MDEYEKKDVQRERWIIVSQIVQTAVICLGAAKSHLCCLGAITAGPLSRGQQHVFRGLQRRWPKHAPKQRREREEERGAMWGGRKAGWIQFCCRLRLMPAGDLLKPSPPSQPASQGSCEGINQNFIQASPDTSTMSQSSKNKNHSWGNKVSPETSSFSMETIYVIDQLWKGGVGVGIHFWFDFLSFSWEFQWFGVLILPEKRFYYMENRISKKCCMSDFLCIVSECQITLAN